MISINSMPKIELHVHLDGSLKKEFVKSVLNISDEEITNQMVAAKKCADLKEYLDKFALPVKILNTSSNLENAAYELTKDLELDNVIYAEIRFAPTKHFNDNLSLDNVVESVLNGLNKNKNVKTNLILCMMRGDSFDTNKKVIDLALKYLNRGVCAIDLAGDEEHFDTKLYEDLFMYAKDNNVPYTIHAGEVGDIKSLKDAISFNPSRIGHGIKAINDRQILDELKSKNILLEVCPTSNYQTNAIDIYSNNPIYNLYKEGINILINTDNRTVSNITLNKEYNLLMENFPFDINDFIKINLSAIDYAFLNEEEKQKLKDKYENIIKEV